MSVPKLEPTYESALAFISWVTQQQLEGKIDRFEAKELRDHAKAVATLLRAKHSEKELEEARALVQRAEEATRRSERREVDQRYGMRE